MHSRAVLGPLLQQLRHCMGSTAAHSSSPLSACFLLHSVFCGASLVYAYWRDPASKGEAETVFDPDGRSVLGESSAFERNK